MEINFFSMNKKFHLKFLSQQTVQIVVGLKKEGHAKIEKQQENIIVI